MRDSITHAQTSNKQNFNNIFLELLVEWWFKLYYLIRINFETVEFLKFESETFENNTFSLQKSSAKSDKIVKSGMRKIAHNDEKVAFARLLERRDRPLLVVNCDYKRETASKPDFLHKRSYNDQRARLTIST